MAELIADDGSTVELAHEDAVAALQSGQYGLRADKPVNFVAPDGSIVNADTQHVETLLGSGYKLAGADDVARDLERQQYGESIGQQALAGVEGVASGATMGLYDVGARALAPEYADELVKRRDYNPVTSGLGEAAGALGAALYTGGASVEAAVTRGAAKVAQQVTTRAIGQAAVSGALEAALFGATKAVSDDYLRDHEITAERVALGAGLGALTGGILGAGSAAIGAAIARSSGAAMLSDAERGIAASLTDNADAATSILSGKADDLVTTGGALGGYAEVGRNAVQKVRDTVKAAVSFPFNMKNAQRLDDVVDGAAQDAAGAVTRINTLADKYTELTSLGPKRAEIVKRFAQDLPDLETMNARFIDAAEALQGKLSHIRENTQMYTPAFQRFAHAVQTHVDDSLGRIGPARDADTAADLFRTFDTIKNRVGRAGSKLVREEPGAAELVDDVYELLRAPLQDAAVVGKSAAAFQSENNAAITAMLQYQRAFHAKFAADKGERVTPSLVSAFRGGVPVASPRKIASFMKEAGDWTASIDEDILLEGAKRQADAFNVLAKNYDLGAGSTAEIRKMADDAAMIGDRVAQVKATREASKAYSDAVGSLRELPGGTVAAALANTAGKLVNLTTPEATVAAAAAKAAAATQVHKAAIRAADSGERALESAGIALARAKTLQRANQPTADALTVLGYEFSLSSRSAVGGLRDHLDGVLQPDGEERGKMRGKLAAIRQASPEMADAMELQAIKTAEFLRSKAGPSQRDKRPGDPFAHLRKEPPGSREDALKMARYIDAAAAPQKAVARLRDGVHRPEDVETLRTLYPRMFQRLQAAVLSELTNAKEVPPEDVQRELARITGAPIDGMTPEKAIALQQLIRTAPTAQVLASDRAGPAGPKRTGKAPKLAGLYEGDSLAERADRR